MDKEFLKGFFVQKKQGDYGSYLRCSIKYDEFINNLVPNDKGYVNFRIYESKQGKPYAVVDNYTPQAKETKPDNEIKNFDDELPF